MLVVKWTFDELYYFVLVIIFYYLSLLVMFLSWLSFDE